MDYALQLVANQSGTKLAASSFILCVGAVVVSRFMRHTVLSHKLPPSPPAKGSFVIGHVLAMPKSLQWETYGEWAKSLGNIIFMSILGQPIVVLNSVDDARNLMDKRGTLYSDRPDAPIFHDLIGMKHWLAFLRYGEGFRLQRRMMQQTFNSQAVKSFREPMQKNVIAFLGRVVNDTESFLSENSKYVTTTVTKVIYGHNFEMLDDGKFAKMAVEFGEGLFSNDAPGSHLTDVFPILRFYPSWFPGGSWKRVLMKLRRQYSELLNTPYDDMKTNGNTQGRGPGLLPRLIDESELMNLNDPEHEEHVKSVAVISYIAAIDTTQIATEIFLLMMMYHPEVMRKAQEEIDRVIGGNRLPEFEDRFNLPYVECVLKEVLRFHPPAPLCVPHKLTTDDIYNGMRMPGGSTIIPNIWQMMRDPKYFPRGDEFWPERFETVVKRYKTTEQALNGFYPDDSASIIYGFGRRICPGRYFADMSIWLVIASTLAAFDVKPCISPSTGLEELPEIKFLSGETSHAVPFKCRVIPRSSHHAKLVLNAKVLA